MADPSGIFMWRRIDERLTTSGQPAEAQLAEIGGLGVTHVVNLGLHTHEKALADEAGCVRALGLEYIHIPVDFDGPAEADFEQFRAVMRGLAGETIHVHCIANLRVAAFLYRYHREAGMPEAEAREIMERVWRPGGAWAWFIGDEAAVGLAHRIARQDY